LTVAPFENPALATGVQVALTLRLLGGLETAEIARAFLVPEATMAQRISRAKQRIKAAGASFDLPPPAEQAERLGVVLHVVYLVFNEGYTATSGAQLLRAELTAEAIRLTRGAEEAGADAALLISPYYNKPTQDGIYRHYAAVADATGLPLILYNIPGRTGSNITPDTIARLARLPNIAGVKEASGNLAQVLEIIDESGADFGIYSGDDILTLPIMAAGGHGVIAVGANLMPRAYVELTDALLAGDLERARMQNHRLLPLMMALTLEVNPIPVKTALAMMGQCADEFRLPLTPMSPGARVRLEDVLREYELV